MHCAIDGSEAFMERITISVDEKLASEFDALIKKRGYTSRSEAMRDLLRRDIEANRVAYEAKSYCVANLSYIYDHHARDLAERLMAAQHEHHDMVVSTMHVHLDHEHCLESVILKGPTAAVRSFAAATQAERGVRHANVNLVTVETGDTHAGAGRHEHHGHLHLIPRS
jgi:CopG family nickel-responsive transcriptional regulator